MRNITAVFFLLAVSLGYAQSTPIDFEAGGNGADFMWTVFENVDNPPLEFVANDVADPGGLNPSATIAKITARVGGAPFAGTVTNDIDVFTLDETNSIVKILVWKSVISDVGIKFEMNGASTGEIKVANTLVNEWEELTFDFSGKIGEPSSTDINGLVVFPDFQDRTQDNVVYFDNITFEAQDTPPPSPDEVTVDASASQIGFANVFENDGTSFVFNSGWGVPDLKTTLDTGVNTITLQPNFNTYADNPGDSFWRNNGGAGPLGNKVFEGATFVEIPNYPNETLSFSGEVLSNTLNTPFDPADVSSYNVMGFIKALDPDNGFATVVNEEVELIDGQVFDIDASGLQGFLIQYGFFVKGRNANPADEAALGSAVVTSVQLGTDDLAVNEFQVFPNPAVNAWTIQSNEPINNIQLFDVLGKTVLSMKGGSTSIQLDSAALNTGLYFAKVTTATGSKTLRLLKR